MVSLEGVQIAGPIICGFLIGFYELILIHRDLNFRGSHWFSHGLHAAIWALVACFAVFNVPLIFELIPALGNIPYIGFPLVFQIIIGLATLLKVNAASAVIQGTTGGGGRGMREKFWHSLVVAVLIVLSPYLWIFIGPLVDPYLPDFLP